MCPLSVPRSRSIKVAASPANCLARENAQDDSGGPNHDDDQVGNRSYVVIRVVRSSRRVQDPDQNERNRDEPEASDRDTYEQGTATKMISSTASLVCVPLKAEREPAHLDDVDL